MKLKLRQGKKFAIKAKTLAAMLHILQTTPNFIISLSCFAEDRNETYWYQELKHTCIAIVLLIKPFIQRRSCYRCHHGFLKLPNARVNNVSYFACQV